MNFSRRLSRRTTIKKYRSERKGRRSFDTAIEYGTVAMIATEKTRTAKSAVRATCFIVLHIAREVPTLTSDSSSSPSEVSFDNADGRSPDEAKTSAELWGKVCPQLEEALGLYEKRDSDSVPEKTWNPLGNTKASYQQQIDKILDTVIRILEISGPGDLRKEIKTLDQAVTESHKRIAMCREQRLSALPEASLAIWEKPWKANREGLEKSIAAEESNIADLRRQIGELKERFRNQLQQIGIEVFDDDIDSLLMPVTKDDFVSMAAVVSNISTLTDQLERLTEKSKELPAQARRYYGMYLLLVYAMDRIQTRFIQEIDHIQLPKLHAFEEEARRNITDAKNQISSGGPRDQLSANIDASKTTIEACHCLAGWLRDQQNAIARENEQTRLMLDAAINTYKTVRLALNLAEFMSDSARSFQALKQIRLPRLRTFQNLQLKAEMQRLAERMRDREE